MRNLTALLVLAACSPPPEDGADSDTGTDSTPVPTADTAPTDTEPPDGACGEITVWDLTVKGVVLNAQGVGAPFADVWLEDRGWSPTVQTLGTGFTDGQGNYDFQVTRLTSAEDCWGTLLNYVIVAELGPQRGEDEVNTFLYTAIQNGTLVADMSSTPLLMEDTSK